MCFHNHLLLLLGDVRIVKTCLLDRSYIVGETRILVVGVVFVVMVNGVKFVNMYVLLIHFNLVLHAKNIRLILDLIVTRRMSCICWNVACFFKQYVGSTVTPFRFRFNYYKLGIVSLMQVPRLHKLGLLAISLRKAIGDSWRISRLQSLIGLQVVIE